MKEQKTKKELSITIDNDILKYIKDNYKNRSKFIEYCILQELTKFDKYKNKLEVWVKEKPQKNL